jgi:hypothetical protein
MTSDELWLRRSAAIGYRSCSAASVLEAEGFTGVADLAGGIAAWTAPPDAVAPVLTCPPTLDG